MTDRDAIVDLVRHAIAYGVEAATEHQVGLTVKMWTGGPGATFPEVMTADADEFVRTHTDLVEALENSFVEMSNITIDGKRQTLRQLYARELADNRRLEGYRRLLADLSRNEHGRHEGDIDGSAPSKGNPHLATGDVLGYSLHGQFKYVVPEPELRHDIDAWKVPNL